MSKAGITSFSSLTSLPHSISESSGDWNHVRSPTQKASMILDQLTWVETEIPTIVDAPALSEASHEKFSCHHSDSSLRHDAVGVLLRVTNDALTAPRHDMVQRESPADLGAVANQPRRDQGSRGHSVRRSWSAVDQGCRRRMAAAGDLRRPQHFDHAPPDQHLAPVSRVRLPFLCDW